MSRVALCLLVALPLAACKVDQHADARAYREIVDLPDPPPAHQPGSDMSLEEAIRLTNAYNEQISIQGESYARALIERRRRAASLLPTLDLFGALAFRDSSSSASSESGGGSRRTRFDAGFGLQYTLLTGLTDFNLVKAAEAEIRAGRWLLLDLREVLLLETARAYYAVLRAERLAEVLQTSVAVQEERLRDIRGRQQVGFARPLDVSQTEAQASQTRVTLLDARNQVATTRAALAFLTGVDVASSALTDGFEPRNDPPSLDAILNLALSHRQDLLAVRASADAARAAVDAEIGRYYPSVSLNLDYFLRRDTSPTDLDWTGLLSVNLPIFSAGRIDADVSTAWSVFRQSVLQYSLLRRQIRRDVESSYADFAASQLRIQELRQQVSAAQQALQQAEAAYQAGLGTNLERVAAQDQLLNAQLRQVTEEFARKLAYLAAMRACGALTENIAGITIPPPEPSELSPPESPFIVLPPASLSHTADITFQAPSRPGD